MAIEDHIESIRTGGGSDREISAFVNSLDENDQIFGLVRAFYITVSMTAEKLSEREGFSIEDRKLHFKALVNLTDFAQLRMIMIGVQFLDFPATKYLRNSDEFTDVVNELGLNYAMY